MPTNFDAKVEAKTTKPGWVTRNQQFKKEIYSFEQPTEPEFSVGLIEWDGR